MNILGITQCPPQYARDTSAVLVVDGEVIAAAAEERFSRVKHHAGFPFKAIDFVLEKGKLKRQDIEYIAIPWDNMSMFSSLKARWKEIKLGQIYYKLKYGTSGRIRDIKSREMVDLKKLFPNAKIKLFGHELSHASSAYRSSGFEKALVLSLDGEGIDKGRLCSGSLFIGEGGNLHEISYYPFDASFGYFYGAVTDELGFKHLDGEGKTMGLAAYGDPELCYDKLIELAPQIEGIYVKRCKNKHFTLEIGSGYTGIYDNTFFHYLYSPYIRYLKERYGPKNLAAAAQKILEERVTELVKNAVDETGLNKICLAGGIFYNVLVNKAIRELGCIDDVFIYPNAGDGGATAGAALELYHELTGKKCVKRLESAYLGPAYTDEVIKEELIKNSSKIRYEYIDDVPGFTAELLEAGKVIGWFQGNAEWGPRALGARSVIADPRDETIKERINNILKRREWFMPFAPSIIEEKAKDYFINHKPSPFMIDAFDVYDEKRSEIPGVIHIDGTARPQTVSRKVNERYYDLINGFYKLTGTPVVLNTSFNKHGLPTLCTPDNAIDHLMWDCVDTLIIGNYTHLRQYLT